MFSSGADETLRVWSFKSGDCLKELEFDNAFSIKPIIIQSNLYVMISRPNGDLRFEHAMSLAKLEAEQQAKSKPAIVASASAAASAASATAVVVAEAPAVANILKSPDDTQPQTKNTEIQVSPSSVQKEDIEYLCKRNIEGLGFVIDILKQFRSKKDGQFLPSPELVFRRAAALGKLNTLQELIERVNDLNVDEEGTESKKTALDFARDYNQESVIQFLNTLKKG